MNKFSLLSILVGTCLLFGCASQKKSLDEKSYLPAWQALYREFKESPESRTYVRVCSVRKARLEALARWLANMPDLAWQRSSARIIANFIAMPAIDANTAKLYDFLRANLELPKLNNDDAELLLFSIRNLPGDCGFVHANALVIGLSKRAKFLHASQRRDFANAVLYMATRAQPGLLTEVAINQYNIDWLLRNNILTWNEQKKFAYENLRRRTDNAINDFRKKLPQRSDKEGSATYIQAMISELNLAFGFANELKIISE